MKYYITCVQKQVSPYGIYEDEERLRELVVCKDCKWFGKSGCAVLIVDESDKPKEDDFCSWAERKDDETD